MEQQKRLYLRRFAWFYTMCSTAEAKAVELWFNDHKSGTTFFLECWSQERASRLLAQ